VKLTPQLQEQLAALPEKLTLAQVSHACRALGITHLEGIASVELTSTAVTLRLLDLNNPAASSVTLTLQVRDEPVEPCPQWPPHPLDSHAPGGSWYGRGHGGQPSPWPPVQP
jgi:hypothetical protein